ncbi:MAG: hypothetical protein LBE92_21645 [Chryseobacterium sp.]|jgi:hypothetical protein|uniref:hypothetical protein n=1 Tax=Chryseobacterium sp. TaxID=1871047 RepID=UPI00281E5068|nr:hypothetical protein [Chryseobacterium sp.]MDR2238726.1 hypothetical protein [Chryseobacterium sp.]
MSCQKSSHRGTVPPSLGTSDSLKNYLNITINHDIRVAIGEMASADENISEDFKMINRNDTVYIIRQFLESDHLDGKHLKVLSKHKTGITVKYNVGFHFMGDEKKSIYLPLNYVVTRKIGPDTVLPSFENIYKDPGFQKFIGLNEQKIYQQAYSTFISYYENIPENELKSCCPDDFENYTNIKKTDPNHLQSLDWEKHLLTVPDYKSMIIDIKDLTLSKNYVLVFNKEDEKP